MTIERHKIQTGGKVMSHFILAAALMATLMAMGARIKRTRTSMRSVSLILLAGMVPSMIAPLSAAAQTDCADTFATGIPQAECEALAALYNDTDGLNWTESANWNTNTACDTWSGVQVGDGRVIRLALPSNDLNGVLTDLSVLSDLWHLDLSSNQLSGDITDVSGMTNLWKLNLSGNQLTGTLSNMNNLTQLQEANLSDNQLTGTIPDLTSVGTLRYLNLSNNQLSGASPRL